MRATNVTIAHSEFGSFSACNSNDPEDGVRFWEGTGGDPTPRNDKFLYNVVHDIDAGSSNTCQGTSHAGIHVDCMQNNGGVNITIEGNIFYNCPTSDIQWNPFSGATFGTQVIQNNWFGPTGCCNGLVLGSQTSNSDCSPIIVRNNVLHQDINWVSCSKQGQVYSNIFLGSCSSGSSYSYNVFTSGSTCGANSKKCTPKLASGDPGWGGGQPNPHLASGDTCAVGAGNPSAAVRRPTSMGNRDPRRAALRPTPGLTRSPSRRSSPARPRAQARDHRLFAASARIGRFHRKKVCRPGVIAPDRGEKGRALRIGTRRRALLLTAAVVGTAFAFWLSRGATSALPAAPQSTHWAMEAVGATSGLTSGQLKALRRAHVGTLVVSPGSVRVALRHGLVKRARSVGFLVVLPRVARGTGRIRESSGPPGL